ncbi:MAG: 4'-phosphopantetheinyl transferase superfamily protein [Chlorobiaceae bacterium]
MNMLDRHTIRLWTHEFQDVTATPPCWLALLDEKELMHCKQFRQEKDRIAYAAAHALLRTALSRALEMPPVSLTIDHDRMGKPFINTPGCMNMAITLSHTSGMVAVALSQAGNIGVDVEAIDRKNIPHHDFSAYGLSHEEIAMLASLSHHERCEAFIDFWTAREAVAKADGRGLSLPFSDIRIDLSVNEATIHEKGPSPSSHWTLWREQPSSRYRLALAWQQGKGAFTRMNEQLI